MSIIADQASPLQETPALNGPLSRATLSVPLPSKVYKLLLPDKLWIFSQESDQDEMLIILITPRE